MAGLRDRLLTPPVARAMTSPLGIVLAGAGAAAGVLVGGGIIGAVALGALAWGGRVAVAVPRGGPREDRIDPFTLGEPWRFYVRDALQAESRYRDAVSRAKEGPLRERLTSIGDRVSDAVRECWRIARTGQGMEEASRRIDVADAQRQLDQLEPQLNERWMAGTPAAETARALRAQIESAGRMRSLAEQARTQLQLLNARMDEMVARTIELSVQAERVSDLSGIDAEVGSMLDDLEALRSALDETSTAAAALPALPGSGSGTAPEVRPSPTADEGSGETRPAGGDPLP